MIQNKISWLDWMEILLVEFSLFYWMINWCNRSWFLLENPPSDLEQIRVWDYFVFSSILSRTHTFFPPDRNPLLERFSPRNMSKHISFNSVHIPNKIHRSSPVNPFPTRLRSKLSLLPIRSLALSYADKCHGIKKRTGQNENFLAINHWKTTHQGHISIEHTCNS